jgi:glycosyltransferase involved in cell wall biosynthesis
MISFIIPSLMRIPRLLDTLRELSDCEEVGEIILIDNSTASELIELPKLIHIRESENTFINPAWNKGAKLARYDKLCFLNDDIWFDWKYLSLISSHIREDVGLIGMSTNNYIDPPDEFRIVPAFHSEKTTRGIRPVGYACCFFIHKYNWDEIPNEMKLWCGDDWLFYRSKFTNYIIDGMKCYGDLSATLSAKDLAEIFDPIKKNDLDLIRKFINEELIENFF